MLRAQCYDYWILVFDMPDFWPWFLFYCKSWQHYFYSEIIQNFSIKKDTQLFLHNVASKKQKLYMGKLNNLRWPLNIVINVKSKACALNHYEFCNICSIFILWFVPMDFHIILSKYLYCLYSIYGVFVPILGRKLCSKICRETRLCFRRLMGEIWPKYAE